MSYVRFGKIDQCFLAYYGWTLGFQQPWGSILRGCCSEDLLISTTLSPLKALFENSTKRHGRRILLQDQDPGATSCGSQRWVKEVALTHIQRKSRSWRRLGVPPFSSFSSTSGSFLLCIDNCGPAFILFWATSLKILAERAVSVLWRIKDDENKMVVSFSSFGQCYAVGTYRMILLRLQQLILLVFVTYTIALAAVWSK